MSVLKIRDAEGNVQEILAIRGEKGDKGEKGDPGEQIHTDADGAVLEDVFVKRNPVYRATPDTLADIISKADAGATIQLLAGAYPRLELVGVKAYPEGLTIVGDEGVTMAGVSMTSGLAKPESGTDINPQMHIPSNLTFKGVTFTDSFCLRNCVIDGLNILDCSITAGNIRLSPDSLVDKYGRDTTSTAATVWQWNSAKPHIRNVVIDGNVIVNADGETDSDKSAIIVSCVDNLEVSNNEIKYAAFNGIQVNGQSNHYSTGKLAIAHNLIRKSGSRSLRIANLKSAKLFVFYNDLRYANQAEENGEVVKVSGCVDTEIAWSLSSTSGGNTYRADDDGVALHYISVGDGITLENCTSVHIERTDNPHSVTAEQVGARPDTWMPTAADVGAAPAGYGLGGTPTRTITSVPDLDNVTTIGWYNFRCMDSYIGDYHLNYASIFVLNYDGAGGVWQEVRPLSSNAVLRRAYHNGKWSDWVRTMSSTNFKYTDGTLEITTV